MRGQYMNSALCLLKQWNVCIQKKKKRKHVDVKHADANAKSKHMQRVCLHIAYFVENWKHCSKTNYKCVNSAVGPIFNEKSCWKVRFVGPMNGVRDPLVCTVHRLFSSQMFVIVSWTVTDNIFTCFSIKKKRKKKKEGKRKMPDTGLFHPYPNIFKVFRIKIRCKTT